MPGEVTIGVNKGNSDGVRQETQSGEVEHLAVFRANRFGLRYRWQLHIRLDCWPGDWDDGDLFVLDA